ncbi:MAG: SurA N-terminal domain-containing protein, partial [Lentisphaeraceae bacterium]|nr:SurA N-terminal domain-containing protein [Lentisphaeraceae bacterium]
MFSKINQEFSKHAKVCQIILFAVIIIPFVFIVPDGDIFGDPATSSKPTSVGSINGKDISWDEYEKEAKNKLVADSFSDNQFNFGFYTIYNGGARQIYSPENYKAVLEYIVEAKAVEAKATATQKTVSNQEIRDYIETNFSGGLSLVRQFTRNKVNLTNKEGLAILRRALNIGGGQLDAIIKRSITKSRIDADIKEKVTVSDDEVIAYVKKQERSYKFRSLTVNPDDYKNEMLKAEYNKIKTSLFDAKAINASYIEFNAFRFTAEAKNSKILTAEVAKRFKADTKTNKTPTNSKSIKADIKRKLIDEIAEKLAKTKAMAFYSKLRASKKTLAQFTSFAKAAKLSVKESGFINPDTVSSANLQQLHTAITKLGKSKKIDMVKGAYSTYIVLFKEQGQQKSIDSVRYQLLDKVYGQAAQAQYDLKKSQFRTSKKVETTIVTFDSKDFVADASDAEIKSAY